MGLSKLHVAFYDSHIHHENNCHFCNMKTQCPSKLLIKLVLKCKSLQQNSSTYAVKFLRQQPIVMTMLGNMCKSNDARHQCILFSRTACLIDFVILCRCALHADSIYSVVSVLVWFMCGFPEQEAHRRFVWKGCLSDQDGHTWTFYGQIACDASL